MNNKYVRKKDLYQSEVLNERLPSFLIMQPPSMKAVYHPPRVNNQQNQLQQQNEEVNQQIQEEIPDKDIWIANMS
jgi:hypothetical protein